MDTEITDITAKIIQNSRNEQTIVVTVCAGGHTGSFAVPSGASTGTREVHAKEPHQVEAIIATHIHPALIGFDVTNQKGIDALLHKIDGTALFDTIGGNVALGISVACVQVGAKMKGVPTWKYIQSLFSHTAQAKVPRLFVNLINGGKHAAYGSPIQEHQIIIETDDVELAYETALQVQEKLEAILIAHYGKDQVGIGDEGGFIIPSVTAVEPFTHLSNAIAAASCTVPVCIGTDIAASSFFSDGLYMIEGEEKDVSALLVFYTELHKAIPLLSYVEDPFSESDFKAYGMYREMHRDTLVIGDDLTTTNAAMLAKAIECTAITGIIIKPNQIGTITDTLDTMKLAYAHNIQCIVSHRSGETMDDFIADLAYGTGCYGLKAGAPRTKEREVKYKRLIHLARNTHV